MSIAECRNNKQIGLCASCFDSTVWTLFWRKFSSLRVNFPIWFASSFSLAVELYLSPIETHCSNIDYFPSIENGSETEESTRLHLARGVIALFILSFFSVICAFFTGLSGESHSQHLKLLQLTTLLFRMLETIGWRNHSNRDLDADGMSAC